MIKVYSPLMGIRKPRRYIPILAGAIALLGLYLSSLYNYLLFHSLAEVFSVVVACSIFFIAWNSRRFLDNSYFVIIGIAYLFIGTMDLVHTLAYPGMGVFPGYGTNLAAQLWIIARYIEGLSLLVAPLLIGRKLSGHFILLGYGVVTAFLLASIFYWNIFPVTFIEGSGLTPFKIISEYIISCILAGAVLVMFRKRREFDTGLLRLLFAAIIVTIFSELSFTFYASPTGLPNLIGHLLKIISFYLIYKAIIETGLVKPYDLLFRNLKHSEEQYRDLYEEAPSAYLAVGADSYIGQANRSAEQLLGYSRNDLIKRPILDFCADTPSGKAKAQEILQRFHTGKEIYNEELEMHRADGNKIWTSLSVRPTYDKKGRVRASRWELTDITDRKQTEQKLRVSEEHFRALAENSSDIIQIVDQDGIIRYLSPSVERVLGYKPAELIGRPSIDLVHPDDLPLVAQGFEAAIHKPGAPVVTECRCKHKDGTWRVIEGMGINRLDNPVVRGFISNMHDITERRQAEQALQESEEKYRRLIESIHDGIWVIDQDAFTTFVNPRMAEMLGYITEEMLGKHLFSFMDKQGMAIATLHLKRRQRGVTEQHEFEFLRKDGSRIYAILDTSPVIDEDGNYTGAIAGVQDITERKLAEEKIRQQKELLERTMESLTNPFYVVNASDYTVVMANSAARPRGRWIRNQKCYTLTHSIGKPCQGPEHLCPLAEVKETRKPATTEHIHYDWYGNKRIIEFHGYPIFDSQGNVIQMLEYCQDITDRKELDQLKDEFIGLVSHELRSPLTVITGAVNTVLTEGARLSTEETDQLLQDAALEAEAMSYLVGNLVELSRAQANRLSLYAEPVMVQNVVQNTVAKIRRQSSAHQFIISIPRQLPQVYADPLRLERILHNLLENAVKYSPEGGKIRVSARQEGENLVFAIRDRGIGISLFDQARLFAPFQRLEGSRPEVTRGTGLGLLVCRRLVEAHGGRIWVESDPDRGSTFFFTLPLHKNDRAEDKPDIVQDIPRRNTASFPNGIDL